MVAPALIFIGSMLAITGGIWFLHLHIASADRHPEDVVVLPVVVAGLECRDVEREVLFAHSWETD